MGFWEDDKWWERGLLKINGLKFGQTSGKKNNPDRGIPAIADVNRQFADVVADDITCVHWLRSATYQWFVLCSSALPDESPIDIESPSALDLVSDPSVVHKVTSVFSGESLIASLCILHSGTFPVRKAFGACTSTFRRLSTDQSYLCPFGSSLP
ncbi:hypothetical protein HAX54_021339 [Datura stramonium]|uniref:Uncharacterized protein n=1 Tax=Datura stramonium TaxID=4076 RepID=A0ABS8USR3_DATST|nr:hypothetical protein [Datura stramonium]